MKPKLIIPICLIVLMSCWSTGWSDCEEYQCEFCGKSICYWVPEQSDYYFEVVPNSYTQHWGGDHWEWRKQEILNADTGCKFTTTIHVCPECYGKHKDAFEKTTDAFIEGHKDQELIDKHNQERNAKEEQKLKDQIKRLKEELEQLKMDYDNGYGGEIPAQGGDEDLSFEGTTDTILDLSQQGGDAYVPEIGTQ